MATLELASNKSGFIKKTEEYFNAIRTNIQLSGSELKVIGITSILSIIMCKHSSRVEEC